MHMHQIALNPFYESIEEDFTVKADNHSCDTSYLRCCGFRFLLSQGILNVHRTSFWDFYITVLPYKFPK